MTVNAPSEFSPAYLLRPLVPGNAAGRQKERKKEKRNPDFWLIASVPPVFLHRSPQPVEHPEEESFILLGWRFEVSIYVGERSTFYVGRRFLPFFYCPYEFSGPWEMGGAVLRRASHCFSCDWISVDYYWGFYFQFWNFS